MKGLLGIIADYFRKSKPVVEKSTPVVNLPEIPTSLVLDRLPGIRHVNGSKVKFDATIEAFKDLKDVFEVNTDKRMAHFWAQMAHETGGFRWFAELGGHTYFKKYDGRRDLGNTKPGDGFKFKGRGLIHLTGRSNYEKFGDKIGIDLVKNPERAEEPDVAVLLALQYWKDRKLNKWADRDDFKKVTKLINGGYNGLSDRKKYLEVLKTW